MKNSFLLLLILLSTPHVYATPAPEVFLTFDQAAEIALRENTDILQIRANEESAKHHESQALSPNSPLFSYTNNNTASPFKLSQGASKTYAIQWTLGFPGKSILQSKQFKYLAQSSREQGYEKEVGILSSLSNLYIELGSNRLLTKILEQEVERTNGVLKIIEKKYGMGQASQIDLLSAKSAVAKLSHNLLNAQENETVLQAQFLNILRKPESNYRAVPDTAPEVPDLTLTEESLLQMMLKNRHAIRAGDLQAKSAETGATVAGMQWLPDLQFTAGMNLYTLPSAQANPDLSRDYTLGIQISIPLFYPLNEMNVYRAAKSDQMAAEYQADSTRLQAISDLKSNYTLYQAGNRQLKDIQKFLLPATKASYDLVLKSYALGKADYLRLADARNNWIDTQKDELSKRAELAQLFNAITITVGCDFRHKGGPHACE